MTNYDVVLQKEIMLEAYAGLMADYNRLLEQLNIDEDDKDNPLSRMYWQINDIHKHILGSRYETMKDMYELRGIFKFFKNFLEGFN